MTLLLKQLIVLAILTRLMPNIMVNRNVDMGLINTFKPYILQHVKPDMKNSISSTIPVTIKSLQNMNVYEYFNI